jgi:hypothetical protein
MGSKFYVRSTVRVKARNLNKIKGEMKYLFFRNCENLALN